jgi:hypothetical protein
MLVIFIIASLVSGFMALNIEPGKIYQGDQHQTIPSAHKVHVLSVILEHED